MPSPISTTEMLACVGDSTVLLLDCRKKNEYRISHLDGAVHVMPGERTLKKLLKTQYQSIVCIGPNTEWATNLAMQCEGLAHPGTSIFFLNEPLKDMPNKGMPYSAMRLRFGIAGIVAIFLCLTAAVGLYTEKHLCCRLTRGAIGSMECHWYDASKATPSALLSGRWKELQRTKEGRLRCKEDTSDAFDKLYADAENILTRKPVSILQKKKLPPSGNRRDFLSLSRYYWPNGSTANGLPYERRDGVTNPEIYNNSYDKRAMETMIDRVRILTLAYFFFEEERFAVKAAEQLRIWFVDDKTSMTPHLRYASYIPGQSTGRGLVPLHELPDLLDAAQILSSSEAWTPKDEEEFRRWMSSYYTWINQDPQGQADRLLRNNRGTWYEVQAAALELYLGKTATVRERLEQARHRRLSIQFEPDGSQPLELERTKPWLYSTYNLQAWMILADIGEQVGVDLWEYSTSDKTSLRTAIEQLVSYSAGRKTWPYKDPVNNRYLYPLLRRAAARYDTPALQVHLQKLERTMSYYESIATLRWPAE